MAMLYLLAFFSSSLSLKCALRESGCRIGYEPTKMSGDRFWWSISRDTNVEVSALSPSLSVMDRDALARAVGDRIVASQWE